MSAYAKYFVGNKLFTIEWDMSVDHGQNNQDLGVAFEAIDCEILSVSAQVLVSSGSPSATFRCSNLNDAPSTPGFGADYALNMLAAGGNMMIPWTNSADPVEAGLSLPKARFYFPFMTADNVGDAGTMKIAALFREL
jgi:hypothetical protein